MPAVRVADAARSVRDRLWEWGSQPVEVTRRAPKPALVLTLLVGAYVAIFTALTWRHHNNFGTFGFDMGIFDQAIWLASRFGTTFMTTRGLDMWANHINPIVYLLAPFYWLGAGPKFLYLLQTTGLAAGAIPLWLLARDRLGDGWLALGVPVAWLLYPSLQWQTWWHFHPDSLAVTPLIFAWWLASKGRWRWYTVCVLLVLATKEDATLPIMALGLVVALRYNRRAGLLTFGGAALWLLTALKIIIPHFVGVADPFYINQFAVLGDSMNEVVYNAIRHPSRILRLAEMPDRVEYYRKMFFPVAGLALLSPVALFIALPTLAVNVVNAQGYPHDFKFHYSATVAAGIFIAVVETLGRRPEQAVRRFQIGLLCAAALATNVAWSPSPLNQRVYKSGIWAHTTSVHTLAMREIIRRVPTNASVSASYNAVPHLTHRHEIWEWPNPWVRSYYGISETDPPLHPERVDYLVLDRGLNPDHLALLARLTAPGGEFVILYDQNDAVLARRVRARGRLATRSGAADLVDLLERLTEIAEPLVLLLGDELHAPRQRLATAAGDAAGDERVEHPPLVEAQPGHDRGRDIREDLFVVAARRPPRDMTTEGVLELLGNHDAGVAGLLAERGDASRVVLRVGLGLDPCERADDEDLVVVDRHRRGLAEPRLGQFAQDDLGDGLPGARGHAMEIT